MPCASAGVSATAPAGEFCAPAAPATRCSNCHLRELCIPAGLAAADVALVDGLVAARRRLQRRETLYQAGAAFKSLYIVRCGCFKSCLLSQAGREQVTGFQIAGDMIGTDGIDGERYSVDVVALEDSEVCVIPYLRLEEMCERIPSLRGRLSRTMGREISRDLGIMLLLGSNRGEERVAGFLLDLSRRRHARGLAGSQFRLYMSREEIGSYLGLKLETVSRIFSRFHEQGVLSVDKRLVRIVDVAALNEVMRRAAPGQRPVRSAQACVC